MGGDKLDIFTSTTSTFVVRGEDGFELEVLWNHKRRHGGTWKHEMQKRWTSKHLRKKKGKHLEV